MKAYSLLQEALQWQLERRKKIQQKQNLTLNNLEKSKYLILLLSLSRVHGAILSLFSDWLIIVVKDPVMNHLPLRLLE